jgi:uncharacterized protein (TIGR03437 family)
MAAAADLTFTLDANSGSGSVMRLAPAANPPCLAPACIPFSGTLARTDTGASFLQLDRISIAFSPSNPSSGLSLDNTFTSVVPGLLSGDPDYATSGSPPNSYSGPVFGIDIGPRTVAGVYRATVTIHASGGADDPDATGFTVSKDISVTVKAASQTIRFARLPNVTLPAFVFTLDAAASSGLAVIYTGSTPDACSLMETTVTPLAPGTCSITASQPGDAVYAAAPPVTQSFTIATDDGSAPQPTGGIANAASAGQAPPSVIAPGSYIAIYGTKLAGAGNPSAASLPLPTTLNGAQATLCGVPMPLLYAAAAQINALVPRVPEGSAQCPLIVTAGDVPSSALQLTMTALQPGIYTVNLTGSGPAVVTDALNGRLNTPESPARGGDFLAVYATGLGAVQGPNGEPAPAEGAATPLSPLFTTKAKITATIGGVDAPVSFAGLTPTFAALYQVNVQVPQGATPGSAVPLRITATDPVTGFTAASNTVTIAIE